MWEHELREPKKVAAKLKKTLPIRLKGQTHIWGYVISLSVLTHPLLTHLGIPLFEGVLHIQNTPIYGGSHFLFSALILQQIAQPFHQSALLSLFIGQVTGNNSVLSVDEHEMLASTEGQFGHPHRQQNQFE